MSQIRLAEGTVPSAPGGASRVLFASSDGIYGLDSAGGTTKFGAAGAGGGIAASAGTQVATSGTLVFSNSNGLTFGLSNSSVLTASHNGLTTAAASNHSHGNPTLNLTNLSGTTASNSAGLTLSLSAAAPGGGAGLSAGTQSVSTGTVIFANSNGLTFGMSGSSQITASHNGLTSQTVQTQSNVQGLSAGTQVGRTGDIVFADSNGISFGLSGSSRITATYTVPSVAGLLSAINVSAGTTSNNLSALTLSNSNGLTFGLNGSVVTASHNGLTTAAASNHSHGNPQLNLTNLSGTTASNSAGFTLSLSAAAGGGGADGYNILAAGTQTAATTGTVAFVNSNGISFGMSNSSQITASYTVPSTAGLLSAINVSAGTTSGNLSALTFNNANGVTFGLNAGTLTASHNGLTSQSNQAVSGSNGSFTWQTVTFGNLNGLSFYTSNGSMVGSHNGLTTARASTDGVGLATAQTNVTWTVNSAGLSINAAGYAGTGTTFNGTNISGSMTLNSAGLRLDASVAAPGGGGAVNFSAGTTSNNLQTVVFSNSNGVSFGLNGSTITASAAGGGGATTFAGWEPYVAENASTFSSMGQNSLYMQKVRPEENYSFNYIEFRVSGSFVSSSNSQVAVHSFRYGLYSLDTNASYNSIATSLMVISASFNSNTAMGYTVSQGAGSFTTTSGGTAIASLMSGFKHLYLPFTNTLSQGVEYAVGLLVSSATTVGTSPMRIAFWNQSVINNLTLGKIYASTVIASNSTHVGDYEQGVLSATTGAMPAAVAKSQMTAAISRAILYHQFEV